MSAWLSVIGIGEDGWDGISAPARAALEAADVVIGGGRHHGLAPKLKGERIEWPSPFRAMIEDIRAMRGRKVAVLVTGDPLWYSAGAMFSRMFPADELAYFPQISAFQWAAARMRWSLADVETLTVHGRPPEQAIPFLTHGARLLVLTQDATTPATLAGMLVERGYGASTLTVLGALGGPRETRIEGVARGWDAAAPDFHTLAIEVQADPGADTFPRTGLPDEAFTHDGKMTKRELRVLTLAALAPARGQRLWDIGAGCGSVAIEWMRAARDMEAVGLEPNAARRAMAEENKMKLGAPRLKLIDATAPEGLIDLPVPDAVFIGGGLTPDVAGVAMEALRAQGRLVANAVTLESESILETLHAAHGGQLIRVAVSRAEPVGCYRGWRAHMPVTQWVWRK
ncbi:MAG: precorrin-6y C5,15-methyltransferase (decarboxylating) subunit CbiE [Brevirhabdus sp.]